ncbi:endoglucanase [Noviherbaspirillum humi]|uniref:Glucanase n=2 Tax=Noviherbaspirillum humi TaxID=1688639 RepID=A0A239HMK8_9BURK|nr:endoglucanase [Noviherbaspirillum humi]
MAASPLRRTLLAAGAAASLLPLPLLAADAAACDIWPHWSGFKRRFLSEDGRVIDRSSPQSITTSEGQSYALFFALVADDRDSFARLLRWTEDNLAGGDLSASLPAWHWGRRPDGGWGVLDDNPASDADLWIAYALIEAGRLWKNQKYAALGRLVAERILREETADIPGFGRVLLPAPRGFRPQPDSFRLNPSYLPVQLMRRMAAVTGQAPWRQLGATAIDVTVRSAPRGFAPDWVLVKAGGSFQPDAATEAVGSYNAIRVYLWAGMLDEKDPARAVLLRALLPAARHVERTGVPPLEAHTRDGEASGTGPAGFSAAMLPFLSAARLTDAARRQLLRVEARAPLDDSNNYYEQVLTLFALGWHGGLYRFAPDGSLIPRWTCKER